MTKKIFATCVAVALGAEIDRVRLMYRSIMTKMYWLSCVVLGKGPMICIATKRRGPNVGESCSLRRL